MAKNMELSFLLDFYRELLTEKQREAIELYYNEDLSLSEIADNEGISRQGVRDAIKRAEGLLLELEERLGLAKRFREVQLGLDQIRESAESIADYNRRYSCSSEVELQTKRILDTVQRLCEESASE
jgi:predicted DNA-binding protein YlxM (UPF0122 family)